MENFVGIIYIIVFLLVLLSLRKAGKRKKTSGKTATSSAGSFSADSTYSENTEVRKKPDMSAKAHFEKLSSVSPEEKKLLDSLDRWDPLEEDRRSLKRRDGRPSYDPDITQQVLGIFH